VTSRHTLEGVLVDPVDGAGPGKLVWEGDRIVAAERLEEGPAEPLVFPGFVDLQVYEPAGVARQGVTGYLLASRRVQEVTDPLCLGLHLEGPFLNPDAAGALPVAELTPVDLAALEEWLASGLVRLVTVSPELRHALTAIHHIAARGVVAAVGHTHANAVTTLAAVNAGARFATHVWNAMAPVRARATGPIPTLLLDDRVVLGVIADGRHMHPRIEQLTVQVAGPQRIALTSDLVAAPGQRADGSLLGGSRCGAALVARMARFGLAEAATMASLVPARVLGLADRGRLAPGFRADFAVLAPDFTPLQTVAGGDVL
jgi:N-acetylglucosamine-6-phosphate deacetylase